MSVTARHPAHADGGRVAVTLESGLNTNALVALARELIGQPPTEDELRIWRAGEIGDRCARCEHLFDPDQAVWRGKVDTGKRSLFGDIIMHDALICGDCEPHTSDYVQETPCPVCGRRIWHRTARQWRRTPCSRQCARVLDARRMRERRTEARQWRLSISCATCERRFVPERSDARYCSSACRQAAYRKRKGGAA